MFPGGAQGLLVIAAGQAGLSTVRMAAALLAVRWEAGTSLAGGPGVLLGALHAAGFQQAERLLEQAGGLGGRGEATRAEHEANTLDAEDSRVVRQRLTFPTGFGCLCLHFHGQCLDVSKEAMCAEWSAVA